ncbi:MAG: Rpn family recombination-promoting nuclease/putative transposase, partial [Treponema sp.]|nr:Rpn family recombination-promoting nuclease/putative transposase [Candidatus Treponema equifaecale]
KFVDIIHEGRKNNLSVKAAVENALDFAIKQNFMNGYFNQCKMEVMNMSLTEFDEEAFIRQMKAEGREEGKIEGRIEGKKEGRIEGANEAKLESARKMIKLAKISFEDISTITDLPIAEIKRIAEELKV